jgi:hypothetical protein
MKATLRFLFCFCLFVALAPLALADDVALYNSIPNPLPGNVPSLGYEATGTGEFGGLIQYADGGAGGSGTFRQDTNWSPYSGAIEFDGPAATPEPSSLLLLGTGLFALAMILTRKSIGCH